MALLFGVLRDANRARLPQFKNKHGELAHTKPDGSDWSPAQWLQAMLGELGELAQVRRSFEHGALSFEGYREHATKEVADVQIYLDIFARRAFDIVEERTDDDAAQILMGVVADLGAYANDRKKFDRGDLTGAEFAEKRYFALREALAGVARLMGCPVQDPITRVTEAHYSGVDLGQASVDKFNEVSVRVSSSVRIAEDGCSWFNMPVT